MKKKRKTRSEAMMGNQHARKGVTRKPSYKELADENEMLREMYDSADTILREIRSLVDL